MMKRKKYIKQGTLAATFGTGLLISCFLPAKCLVVVLSIIVVALGLYTAKCC